MAWNLTLAGFSQNPAAMIAAIHVGAFGCLAISILTFIHGDVATLDGSISS